MKKRKIIAITVTVVLLAFIFHKLNWGELVQTFKTFNFKNMLGIVVFYVLGLYLRGVRWKALLMNDPKYSLIAAIVPKWNSPFTASLGIQPATVAITTTRMDTTARIIAAITGKRLDLVFVIDITPRV